MDLKHLLLDAGDAGSNEYKEGFNTAICYLNDNFIISKRNGEPITLTFDIEFDEDDIVEKIAKAKK